MRQSIADDTRQNFIKNPVFVMDRDYTDPAKLNECMRYNISFVANMNIKAKGCFIYKTIADNYKNLISRASYNLKLKQNTFTVHFSWNYGSQVHDGDGTADKKDLFLHLYYDDKLYKKLSDVITQNLALVCEILNSGAKIEQSDLKKIQDNFVIFDDKRRAFVISDVKVDEHIKYQSIRALTAYIHKA